MRELFSLLRRMDMQGLFRRPTTNAMVQFFRYAFVGGFAAVVDWGVVWLWSVWARTIRWAWSAASLPG